MATRTYTALDEPIRPKSVKQKPRRRMRGGGLPGGHERNPWESGGSHHKGNTAAYAGTDTAYMHDDTKLCAKSLRSPHKIQKC